MKSYLGKALALALALSLCVVSLAGCHKNTETDDTNTVAAIFDGENIYMNEAKAYIYTTQYDSEVDYSLYIAYYYQGADKYWATEESGVSYWEVNLTQAMQRLYQTKALCKAAEAAGLTLTEEQQKKVDDSIDNFMEQEKVGLEYAGADRDMVVKLLTENALANAYYEEIIKDVDTELDEEEFRRKKVSGVSIVAKDSKSVVVEDEEETEETSETTEDEEETEAETQTELVNFSDDEKAANVETAKEEISELLKNGTSAEDIVTEYAESETVTVTALDEEFKPTYEDKVEGDTFESPEQLAWSLATGEVGSATIEEDDSEKTYVIYCENDDDADLRKTDEDEELQSRKDTLFEDAFAKIKRKYSEFHVFTEKVGQVEYKGAVYESNITVDTGDDSTDTTSDETEAETTATEAETTAKDEEESK